MQTINAMVPTLSVRNGRKAIDFYKEAFGAEEIMRVESEEGLIVAEMTIGTAHFFIADESPDHGHLSPESAGGVTIRIGLFTDNPDAVAARAVSAGATLLYPVEDQSYGYRLGAVKDPFGQVWEIARKL